MLHALPIFHSHGLFVAINVTLTAGSSMILLPRFDLDEIMRLLPRATSMMGVPTFYSRLLQRPDFTRDFASHIRLFVSGSAPLSAETHKEFAARTGKAILERYGMTETNMNTSNPYHGVRVPGSVGLPLARCRDPHHRAENGSAPVAPGEIGIIETAGPTCFTAIGACRRRQDEFGRTASSSPATSATSTTGYVYISGRGKD